MTKKNNDIGYKVPVLFGSEAPLVLLRKAAIGALPEVFDEVVRTLAVLTCEALLDNEYDNALKCIKIYRGFRNRLDRRITRVLFLTIYFNTSIIPSNVILIDGGAEFLSLYRDFVPPGADGLDTDKKVLIALKRVCTVTTTSVLYNLCSENTVRGVLSKLKKDISDHDGKNIMSDIADIIEITHRNIMKKSKGE